MNNNFYWKAGDTVLLRGVWNQKIWFVIVAYVVQDSDDLIALYWQPGTPNRLPAKRITGEDFLVKHQPELYPNIWKRTNLLMLVKPGNFHSVELMWDESFDNLICWYINLQEPLRRTPLGFDTMDLALDIVISPDLTRWQWKDEDEFKSLVEVGVISNHKSLEVRTEGEK